jgi:16S rRNA (uracil1498-N3)-methyltransferase
MLDRFHTPESLAAETATGEMVELTGPEAHHPANVLRKQPGDRVELFDGQGAAATAEIISLSRRTIELRIVDRSTAIETSRRQVTLATAVPKGDRFRWLVEKATELGVERLIPLQTTRSVVDPRSGKLDKMRQAVIAACKQSGRNRLLEIAATTTLAELLDGRDGSQETESPTLLIAHPGGEAIDEALADVPVEMSLLMLIGPEGGFTDEEVAFAESYGAKTVSLGPHILRIETAALAAAAVLV